MTESTRRQSLAIIPARGGSKGIPRKNVSDLGGIPLVAWSILAAKASKSIDRIVVSTEDQDIAEISKRYGAEVPFLRPKELAGDRSLISDMMDHLVSELEKRGEFFDVQLLLYPTHPFRTPELIDRCVQILRTRALGVFSVSIDNVRLGFWIGNQGGNWHSTGEGPAKMSYVSTGLASGRASLPGDLRSYKGVDRLRETNRLYELGDIRFGRNEYVVIDDPVMITDIDTEEDLDIARELLAAGEPPWIPEPVIQAHGIAPKPQKEKTPEPSQQVCFKVSVVKADENTDRQEDIHLDGIPSPARLRTLVDETTRFKGFPVIISDATVRCNIHPLADYPILLLDGHNRFPVGRGGVHHQLGRRKAYLSPEQGIILEDYPKGVSFSLRGNVLEIHFSKDTLGEDRLYISIASEKDKLLAYGRCVFDGKQWHGSIRGKEEPYDGDVLVSGDAKAASFAIPAGCGICCYAASWRRPGQRTSEDQIEVSIPIEIPGWIKFNVYRGEWVNEHTGQEIVGRQALPPIFAWANWAYLPAHVTEDAVWSVQLL